MFIVNEYEESNVFKSSVFSTKDLALKYCAFVIIESIKEWDLSHTLNSIVAKELEENIAHKEYEEALNSWNEYEQFFYMDLLESELDQKVELVITHKCLDCKDM